MVPAMQMVASARFRYSAALVPLTDTELDQLDKVWLHVHQAAWRLPPGFASAPFVLPEQQAGLSVGWRWYRPSQLTLNSYAHC